VEAQVLDLTGNLERALEALPERPAVFLLHPAQGAPYLARTALLRRRLRRLLGERAGGSRLLTLRGIAVRAEWWPVGSNLSALLLLYELARRYFPDSYNEYVRLRFPVYVKVLLANPFPRTQVTGRLSASQALHYGPFRTRAAAERFEQESLDLFQVRRCQEDLAPTPDHPGCVYGEMSRCLRPCQQVVSADEYRAEAGRLVKFLETGGHVLLETIAASRDRLSQEMEFEEARRQHVRYERVEQVLRLRDELAADIDRLHGVAVTPSPEPGLVELRFVQRGQWQPACEFRVAPVPGEAMVPLDRRLRQLVESLNPPRVTVRERQEHLALLARWFYSSWRDGEWLPFDHFDNLPYRKLVRAISRAAQPAATLER
jgi:excinuclease ABC subunit C